MQPEFGRRHIMYTLIPGLARCFGKAIIIIIIKAPSSSRVARGNETVLDCKLIAPASQSPLLPACLHPVIPPSPFNEYSCEKGSKKKSSAASAAAAPVQPTPQSLCSRKRRTRGGQREKSASTGGSRERKRAETAAAAAQAHSKKKTSSFSDRSPRLLLRRPRRWVRLEGSIMIPPERERARAQE